MKNLPSRGYALVLLTVLAAGVGWGVSPHLSSSEPYRVQVAGYDFSAGTNGNVETTSRDEPFKGVMFGADVAEPLKQNGHVAVPITVTGSTEGDLSLDYLMFFEPFTKESVLGSAEKTLFAVGDPSACTVNSVPEGATPANRFYVQEFMHSPTPEQPETDHYCFVATAPSDADQRKIFESSTIEKEPDVLLNIRHQIS